MSTHFCTGLCKNVCRNFMRINHLWRDANFGPVTGSYDIAILLRGGETMSDPKMAEYVGDSIESMKSVGDAAQKAEGALHGIGADVLSKATGTAHDAQARSTKLVSDMAEQAEAMAETEKSSIADRLEGVADAFNHSGEALRGKEDWLAQLIDRGAGELTAFAQTLRSNDVKALLLNLQNLGRRQPALFMGASVAAGFALARVGRVAVVRASTEVASDPVDAPK